MESDLEKILLPEETIQQRVRELAELITKDYEGKELTVISILNGTLLFAADLLRRVPLPLRIESWRVSSYHGAMSSGDVTFHLGGAGDFSGRHILVIEDILDTGLTLNTIYQRLQQCGALGIKICVLLRKDVPRLAPIEADYVGFDIPNEFVVGYGLDYNERYRNLPHIGVLKTSAIEQG